MKIFVSFVSGMQLWLLLSCLLTVVIVGFIEEYEVTEGTNFTVDIVFRLLEGELGRDVEVLLFTGNNTALGMCRGREEREGGREGGRRGREGGREEGERGRRGREGGRREREGGTRGRDPEGKEGK